MKDLNLNGNAKFYYNNQIPYAAVPKSYLKDKDLSLKAKGLLTILYTLGDEWKYNFKGLCKITGQSEKVIRSVIHELEEKFYIERIKRKDKEGKFFFEWEIKIDNFDWRKIVY